MDIYILEDQVAHQNRLQNVLKEIEKKVDVPLNIKVVTGKPEELLENITTFGKEQLYFLDIELKGSEKRGLEIAQAIRERDEAASIVFVTTHSEFAAITYSYQVSALGFVNKDVELEQFSADIEHNIRYIIDNHLEDQGDFFEIKTKNRHIKVPFRDIYFIETSQVAHKLVLLTDKQRIEFYDSMKNIEKLEPRLFRCHKAFLINPYRVSEIDAVQNEVIFTNNLTCMISRRQIKALRQRMKEK